VRHFHAPGRCPQCRSERIEDPVFRIETKAKKRR
jgi:predicted Zn-ribbon and HTH transcriptional regulator